LSKRFLTRKREIEETDYGEMNADAAMAIAAKDVKTLAAMAK
jgi:hypothetical protein